ncbi:MAG TPA: methylenetetrahydrofolate reductase [Rhizomicrobium sp.]
MAADGATGPLTELLANASIEVTPREPGVAETLKDHFAPGTDVHVTFLPDDSLDKAAETCVRLRRAGFNPIPHLTARNFTDRQTLDRQLARLQNEALVSRALVIAGDVDRPRGLFSSSIEVVESGLLEQRGVRTVLFAGHPEGHPAVADPVLDSALAEKIAAACRHGLQPEIVTQFCFEAEPIARWLVRLRALGIDVPVRIGVAGPASTASLLKFAMRCGVGNSLRALRQRGSALGKLMGDTTPEALLGDLAQARRGGTLGPISGIHLYMFGGVRKTAAWLDDARRRAESASMPRRIAGQ